MAGRMRIPPRNASTAEHTRPAGSIDAREAQKFAAFADHWWDPQGPMRPLHRLNPLRLQFIRDEICRRLGRDAAQRRPLAGLKIIDIGCGGGILTEPVHRMGAVICGLDATQEGVQAARRHADLMGLDIEYRQGSLEDLANERPGFYNVLLCMEVIEHVASLRDFFAAAQKICRPGGLLFAATINRTWRARALALFAAERILRWLPEGTHDYDKLVRPDELAAYLRQSGFEPHPPIGIVVDPLRRDFALSSDCAVNYMLCATRSGAVDADSHQLVPAR